MNANEILPLLWQGGKPPIGSELRMRGFSLLVLCAMEYQLPAHLFEGVEVVYAPNDDSWEGARADRVKMALTAARRVSAAMNEGRKCLVTCWAGINRSGLVTGISLHIVTGWSGDQCVRHIRARRKKALGNPHFSRLIRSLGTKRPQAIQL